LINSDNIYCVLDNNVHMSVYKYMQLNACWLTKHRTVQTQKCKL